MAKQSEKKDKNRYYESREKTGLTREAAADLLGCISSDRIERIENGRISAKAEDALIMSHCYNDPELCNYYCTQECVIGKEYMPVLQIKSLSQITLEVLATLNAIIKEKDRLIEITVDGLISDDEIDDFNAIQERLDEMSIAIQSLKLWVSKSADLKSASDKNKNE